MNRTAHIDGNNHATAPALPRSAAAAATPTPPPPQPHGTSPLSLFHAQLHNSPLTLYLSPTYPDRISREAAFFDPELPIYTSTLLDCETYDRVEARGNKLSTQVKLVSMDRENCDVTDRTISVYGNVEC